MGHVPLAINEEIALEGLDGITLESFWFRMSERMQWPLPFNDRFKAELWKIILKRDYFEFYEIEVPRKTVGRLNRIEYQSHDEKAVKEVHEFYHIYTYSPIDDPEIRGSCREFKTRKKLDRDELKSMSFLDVVNLYGDKLVVVASQKLRNSVLIPSNIGRECDINNHVYCILERIGRSRYFGETTSGTFSLNDYVKDSKLLHYFRMCLLKNNLVFRQQIFQRMNNKSQITQLFHIPKYYVVVRASDLLQVEKLVTFLFTKPNNIAPHEEVRNHLNLKSQKTLVQLMRSKSEIFEYKKFPYRDLHPNATKKEYSSKNGLEKTILAIRLIDPNLNIFQLYENEEKDTTIDEEKGGFLDVSKQKLKIPLVYQVIQKITESGSRGISQSEIGKYFGLSKLNSRAVLRKVLRTEITTYMRDEGRQRITMFISKKFASEKSQVFVNQVAKLFKKAEENVTQSSTIQMLPYESLEIGHEESLLVPIASKEEMSPTKISIPINFLKQEASSSVIQFVEHPNVQNIYEQQQPILDMEVREDINRVILMPNDDYSFVDNVENVQVSLRFLNNIPGLLKQSTGLQEELARNRVSEKVLFRMNTILEAIRDKAVMDPVNLLMALRKAEVNFTENICRKSLLSLCSRLAADNFIKVVEMELKSSTKAVKLLFFGEPTITFDMRCWHSIIEEQKIQHFVTAIKSIQESEEDAHVVPLPSNISYLSKTSVGYEELSAQSPIHENFPKFTKYRLFHEFLYYLIYDYPAEVEKIHMRKAVGIWRRENQRLTDYDEIAEKISICYSTDINWKMFIPPLNPQFGYEHGWGFLRDIIHRIPLILYVKFTRYGNFVPEINDYLAHPIKSNYLLHFLPPKMFTKLTQGRKFIQVIVEMCKRLCWMGILQFGPMRTKEIDQSFIYLNRNAMLLDTRSSAPGYMEISDKEYPKLRFTFNSSDDVTNYWSSMFEICINTRINQKSLAFGQTIILEQLHTKPDLIKALKPQTSVSASLNDNGEIPGDRKGAGGLDKGFMSHLKQSWSRSIDRKKRPISALTVERKPRPKSVKKEKAEKTKSEGKKKKSAKVKAAETHIQKSKVILQSNFKGVSSKSKIIRKVKPKKQTIRELKKKSELYDDVDKEALKLMKTLRVVWSDIEDKTLSLIKVAMKFAFPNDNQCAHYVNFGLVRDILHWRTEKALNKTSRACQRRMMYLMKNNKAFREQTFLYLEELRANREFSNKYNNFAERLKQLYNQEQIYLVVKVHLVEMIHRMHQIFLKQYLSYPLDVTCAMHEIILDIPSDYEELKIKYRIVNPNANLDDSKFHEPTNLNEIEISILASLIHGAVCSTNDKISNTFFLHETYSKFSDDNLGAAVNLLRRLTIISLNKNHRSKKLIMPRTISPFHLSNRYASQLMSVHVPVELYDEYLVAVRDISAENNLYQMRTINCGWLLMIAELLNRNLISMKTERCDKSMLLDTPLRKKTNFEKISDNYLMMKNKKEQTGIEEKKIKSVRFHADNNSDEKFIYHDDPIEIFCKLGTIYLHIFCILQAIEHNENVKIDEWTCTENDKCSLKNCVIRSGNNFSIELQKIACHGYDIIKYILNNSDEGPSKYDESIITKFNLVKFFDSVIKKYVEDNLENTKKNFGKVESNFDIRQKISTLYLLDCIQRIATELENEDGAWLSEYKKISHHKTDDEVFYDEEDVDQSKIVTKTTGQVNVNKTADSFVVNLSSLHISLNVDKEQKATIDGDPYNQNFIPFDEDFRSKLLEEIKMRHVWMPEDMQKKSLQDDLDTMIISKEKQNQLEQIHNFLKTKKQIGANINEILELFGSDDKEQLHKNIEELIKLKYVLRTGVNEIRFIHKDYAVFWLIDTFYLTAKDSDEILEPPSKKTKPNDQSTQGGTDNEETPMDVDESIISKTMEQTDKKAEEPEKNLQRNPFFLLPCPWIRVGSLNRTLNRRCFDKWLGTVLNYLSVNPGIILSDLCSKFNVITPVHVRNLCEILEMVGCIKIMAFPELNVSIFSDYDSHDDESKPATFLDAFSRTYIEVNPDAFLRLTFFIGKKKYKLPFI